ncbi:MAG: DUF1854 domain-containing protein [Bdellovibrionales bacterium]|nr:DUF1854 domain-containing protein [Bdellovibrionales bacterium]
MLLQIHCSLNEDRSQLKNRRENDEQNKLPFGGSGFLLSWNEDEGKLLFVRDEKKITALAKPCFPWSEPFEKISIRDLESNELTFVTSVNDLEAESKQALLSALKEACFYFAVVKITAIEEDFELRTWSVETEQGSRRFQTKLNAWPSQVGENRYIVRDVNKDLYVIENTLELDTKSQKLFWPLSD